MKTSIDDKNAIGLIVRRLRLEENLSQQELARLAGVSFSFVNQVEQGKQTVRLDALNKLLSVFRYSMVPTPLDKVKRIPANDREAQILAKETPKEESVNEAPRRSIKDDWMFF